MEELIQKKMEIAEKVGKLHSDIEHLSRIKKELELKRKVALPIQINIKTNSVSYELYSGKIEGYDGTQMHSVLIDYLDQQIEKRKAELNDLIKIPQ